MIIEILNQLVGLYSREVKSTYKNRAVIVLSIAQPLMWIVFFGSSFSSAPRLFLESFFHTNNYIEYLLPGQLSAMMLYAGMFSSLSLIQDKKSGYLRRIMVTPTRNFIVFLAKVLGASTRGLLQVPIVFLFALLFGVTIPVTIVGLSVFIVSLFLLSIGFSSIYVLITMKSSDWQIPSVIANFINLPLMFASSALFPIENFPAWMRLIAIVNPITYSSALGREIILDDTAIHLTWIYFFYLSIFALVTVIAGILSATKMLKVE